MISGIDITDYRETNPQELWKLAEYRDLGKKITIDGQMFTFGWLDGQYCNVFDKDNNQYTINCMTVCVPLFDLKDSK